jgi:hypothetical protein
MPKIISLILLACLLTGCLGSGTFQAYEGEARPAMQLAILDGEEYLRQDWLNRYVDSVRFSQVDGKQIEESAVYESIEIAPGFHDVTVYFYWDMGSQRGLAPALVSYASTRETLSRTLRFNARAGERYTVHAQPRFGDGRRDITTLIQVDFWIEDDEGNVIVTPEDGRYVPAP